MRPGSSDGSWNRCNERRQLWQWQQWSLHLHGNKNHRTHWNNCTFCFKKSRLMMMMMMMMMMGNRLVLSYLSTDNNSSKHRETTLCACEAFRYQTSGMMEFWNRCLQGYNKTSIPSSSAVQVHPVSFFKKSYLRHCEPLQPGATLELLAFFRRQK